MGQRGRAAGIAEWGGRVRFTPPLPLAEAEKAPQRRKPPGNGRLRVTCLGKSRDVPAEFRGRDRTDGRAPTVVVFKIVRQGQQVLAVALDGVIGRVPFGTKMSQELSDGLAHGASSLVSLEVVR